MCFILDFISEKEGKEYRAYSDKAAGGKGDITIGIGFNMDRPGARKTLESVGIDSARFDVLKSGQDELTEKEFQDIANLVVEEAREVVNCRIHACLKLGQLTALTSLVVNGGPGLLGPKITRAVNEGDHHAAVDEILFDSGTRKNPKLMRRRFDEAVLYAVCVGVGIPTWEEYRKEHKERLGV